MEVQSFDLDDLELNMAVSYETVLGENEVRCFADLSGDYSPLHVDKGYGRRTVFGHNLVHGMLISSHFSTLVGMFLPGKNALLTGIDIDYVRPVRVGSRLVISASIKKIQRGHRVIILNLLAFHDGEICVQGTARVKVLESLSGRCG